VQDRPPRHKEVPDDAPPESVEFRRGRQVRVELKGPLGCLAGAIILTVGLAILLVAAFAGLIALAVAFWIGLGFVALAIIAALIRGRLG
jgi:hypothetical protein